MKRFAHFTTGVFAVTVLYLSLASSSAPMLAGEPSMGTKPNAGEVGIWKAYAPRGMKGELNNYDPIGLIAGALIHATARLIGATPTTASSTVSLAQHHFFLFRTGPKRTAARPAMPLKG